jgi:hypothetical protein
MAQNMRHGTVYGCAAPALVVESTSVADTRQYQPMPDSIEVVFVVRKPGDRTDRCRNEGRGYPIVSGAAPAALSAREPRLFRKDYRSGDHWRRSEPSCSFLLRRRDSSLPLSAA